MIKQAELDKYRYVNQNGHEDFFDKELPWWTHGRYELHTIVIDQFKTAKMYCKPYFNEYEYAYVEWRAGSAYLCGLYLNGKDITPLEPRIIDAKEFKNHI